MKRLLFLPFLLSGLCLSLISADASEEALEHLELYTIGKKFQRDPLRTRVLRLERADGTSLYLRQERPIPLRVAQLMAKHQVHVSQEMQKKAIQAYNRGIDQEASQAYDRAMESYREATRLNPRMLQAYNNLAHLLEQTERIREAVNTLQQATLLNQDNAVLYRNLGVLYEKAGEADKAMQAYRRYLQLSPQDADPQLRAAVQLYESSNNTDGDYAVLATQASQGETLIWPEGKRMLPVYIQFTAPGQDALLPVIRDSFQAWEKATNSAIRFQEITNPNKAKIQLRFEPGPLTHPHLRVGHAQYTVKGSKRLHKTMKVAILVHTGDASDRFSPKERQAKVGRLVLHELGHAIGIWGHSPNPKDVMYMHPLAFNLSDRDITTARKLYRN